MGNIYLGMKLSREKLGLHIPIQVQKHSKRVLLSFFLLQTCKCKEYLVTKQLPIAILTISGDHYLSRKNKMANFQYANAAMHRFSKSSNSTIFYMLNS